MAAGDATAGERRAYERERARRAGVRDDLIASLTRHVQAKRAALKGKKTGDGRTLFEDWLPVQPRAAMSLYRLMDSTNWGHLPGPGGWLDQDEALMDDVALLAQMAYFIDAQLEVNEGEGKDHA